MNIIHVVPHIYNEASGPSYTVPKLCEALSQQGATVELHVLEPLIPTPRPYKVFAYPRLPILKRLNFSPALKKSLTQAAKNADILHNHSLWLMPNLYPAAAIKNTPCLLIVSPRGTLSEYALNRSYWRKKIVWWLGQEKVLKRAACFHATADSEWQDLRRLGLKSPVAVIPNGIDIPVLSAKQPKSYKRLLFLSRIHPKKNLDLLLQVWAKLQRQFPDWELCLTGPDNDGYLVKIQQLAKSLQVERVIFTGPVYGEEKSRAYQAADLFILPTRSENFGMVVAEALAHGVPAIVSAGAPWAGLETRRCGWWVEAEENILTETLREAMALQPAELQAMGQRGRQWMTEDFSWENIGKMMLQTYQWLLDGGSPPAWIKLD